MILETARKGDYARIKRLYKSAFPKAERVPFFILKRKAFSGRADMLAARENGIFIGFLYLVCYKDLVYLFYFAIDGKQRGKGYGSRFLQQLKGRYKGRRLFLAREQLEETAANYQQRINRRGFYLKNGFLDMPCQIKEASVIYDVMGIGGTVTAKEYDELILNWGGRLIKGMIGMSLIETRGGTK